jgi:hypothetical protein
VDATRPRRRKLHEISDGASTALLRHPDQAQQDLRRRYGVGEGAMTGTRVRDEPVRKRGEICRLAAKQATSETNGVDDSRHHPAPGQTHRLVVEERHVEACVVRDEDGVVCEGEKAADAGRHGRRPPELFVAQPGQRRDGGLQPCSGIRERLEALLELELTHAHRADLAGPRRSRAEAGRLQIEDDEGRALEEHFLGRRRSERDEVARPPQAGVVVHRLVEQRAREPDGNRAAELQDEPRSVLDGNGAAPLLDQLDETVGAVEAKLHRSSLVRTGVRV